MENNQCFFFAKGSAVTGLAIISFLRSSTGWITGKEYSLRLWNELLESFAGRAFGTNKPMEMRWTGCNWEGRNQN